MNDESGVCESGVMSGSHSRLLTPDRFIEYQRTNRFRETEERVRRIHVLAVLDVPDGSEHGLREGPREEARAINGELIAQNVDPTRDDGRVGTHVWRINRVPERCTELVFHFADYALGIDGEPPAIMVEQHIGMVQVTVQKTTIRL